jgi:hypothetical protein
MELKVEEELIEFAFVSLKCRKEFSPLAQLG